MPTFRAFCVALVLISCSLPVHAEQPVDELPTWAAWPTQNEPAPALRQPASLSQRPIVRGPTGVVAPQPTASNVLASADAPKLKSPPTPRYNDSAVAPATYLRATQPRMEAHSVNAAANAALDPLPAETHTLDLPQQLDSPSEQLATQGESSEGVSSFKASEPLPRRLSPAEIELLTAPAPHPEPRSTPERTHAVASERSFNSGLEFAQLEEADRPGSSGLNSKRRLRAPTQPTGDAIDARAPQPMIDFSWDTISSEAMTTIGAALAVVVGLVLLLAWIWRRAAPRSSRRLPSEVISVVGRVSLANRQVAQLMKVGGKLVLLCVTPDGVKPLTEITDPEEVARLLGLCEQDNPHSATTAFREVFDQLTREPATPGFLGDESPLVDRQMLADAYANTPGGRAHG